jgi:lipopolysaccharide transport system ATP-binding protein
MADPCISLDNVSLRFRMSYHKALSMPQHVAQWSKRAFGKWKPEYFEALTDINLQINRGEVVGVLGRNGAGKSSLLRTISGIYHPDSGTVKVDGRISALLQLGTGFNNSLSGRENIILGGLTLGFSLAQIQERLPMIIDFAEVGDFIDVPTRYYSSGMIARLSFSMVVSMEPDVLLIDETLSVGDLAFQKKSQEAMRSLLQRASCQVIVSHSMETIRRLCGRAILIDRGKLIGDGSPDDVIAQYQRLVATTEKELPLGPADLVQW